MSEILYQSMMCLTYGCDIIMIVYCDFTYEWDFIPKCDVCNLWMRYNYDSQCIVTLPMGEILYQSEMCLTYGCDIIMIVSVWCFTYEWDFIPKSDVSNLWMWYNYDSQCIVTLPMSEILYQSVMCLTYGWDITSTLRVPAQTKSNLQPLFRCTLWIKSS